MKTGTVKTIGNNVTSANKDQNAKTTDAAKVKAEMKPQEKTQNPMLNLESTLEVLALLQTKTRQRNRLIETINSLNAFEIATEKDEDEMGGGHYQACSLKIEDDNRNQFKTNNPVVIEAVTVFIKEMCKDRLTDIEATIVLP